MSGSDSGMDSMVAAIQWVGVALGVSLLLIVGGLLYFCCRKGDPEDENASALLDGLLRRDQLDGTELDGDGKGWQCVVCAYTNNSARKTCLMCGTSVDFLASRTLNRHKSSKTVLLTASSMADDLAEAIAAAAAPSSEEEEMRARQRAFVKRRLNALEARQSLSQRQRGAIRRRIWERKVLDDGKFHWIRQNSHDIVGELPPTSSFISATNSMNVGQGVALTGPSGESVVDYHNLRSQGYVSQYDELGRLTWKRADEVAIDLGSAEFKDALIKDEKIDFEGVMALDFRRKKQWFLIHLSRIATPVTEAVAKLTVTRDTIMQQTIQLAQAPKDAMRTYLKITFTGEPGIDAGGLLREWFGIVCKDIFSAERGLFVSTKGEDMSYWINPLSAEKTKDHLLYFRLAGILIGKALFEGLVMDVHLALPLLKHVLGIPISFSDLEFLDDELHRNCQWLKKNTNVENLCLTFSVMLENGQEIDLKENGRNIDVTDENKEEYLTLVLEHRMLDSIAEQLQEFLNGIYDVVPKALLSVFDYQELELMLCGIPTIDVDDWRSNSHIRYIKDEDNKKLKILTEKQDEVVAWFWDVVESMAPEERARLLQFATGTSRVPVEGFRGLTSSSGIIHQFTIQLVLRGDNAAGLFPKAHTCFNRIDLPMYQSMEELERYLTMVSQMEILGFGLE